ncbi:phospholipase D family protein [Paraconexibacter antarcticus]|uniref:Phospholipase D family protein n=1 Tax=Paraconexibacter antarcticus TaxID=2949664 RepID=A0ABY5DNX8_9ACTN|nr:phospholipase D family protein [Paraconexibacter antarcticus]UTI62517.1 phospholipase D family protein [Paraconexibacter antarcticus]
MKAPGLAGRVDGALGTAIERSTERHHARRLGKLGQEARYAPPDDGRRWAAGTPAPRAGNAVEILIGGAAYGARLAEAIAGARRSVTLAGWCLTPGFQLVRDEPPVVLRELLAEASGRVDVRVLLWAGAPVPLSALRRAAVREVAATLSAGSAVRVALDDHERPLHCHHEKVVVIDDEVAFVGGIDLTDLSGDRYDTPEHPARGRMGWHDLAAELRGPAVADVAAHLAQRWQAVTREALPSPPPRPSAAADPPATGGVEVQVVRTVPEGLYPAVPRGDFRILEAYQRGLRSAQHLIYLENQFLWSPEIVRILAGKLRDPPCDEFRIVAVLPGRPNTGQDDTRGQLGVLADADRGHGRFLATTIRAHAAHHSDRVYVHAKVAIVDDRWMTLGSANLNAHSFFNDTEVNLVIGDADLARRTRLRLWAAHLERSVDEVDGPAHRLVDEVWRPTAAEQRARHAEGLPVTHRLVELPSASRRAERLLGPLQALVVDG